MIDLHSHVLPGLDDGAQTMDDSLELGRTAERDGIRVVAATPHVSERDRTTPDQVERGVAEVRAAFASAAIPVDVVSGGEIAYSRLDDLSRDDLGRFSLGGGGRYLLLELPWLGWPLDLDQRIFELMASGLIPVIAHPERVREVQSEPRRLVRAVEMGALLQITASSVDGRSGRSARATAQRLLDLGMAHLVASDAHTPDIREIGLSEACRLLGDDALATWMAEDVPAAILAGEDAPERPVRRRRRRLGIF